MPFSFLANLGSGLARLGSAFGRGAASVGKGVGRGFKRLGELGEGDYDLGPGGTPPFVPRSSSGQVGALDSDRRFNDVARNFSAREDAVALAEEGARDRYGAKKGYLDDRRDTPIALPDLPISRRNLPIPAPTPAPSLAELRSPLPSLPSRTSPPMVARSAPPVSALPDLVPDIEIDRRNVPIPRLPGHAGGPASYGPVAAAEYDYVMKHAKRDPEGRLLGKEEGGGFNRDWKTIAQNILRGASLAAGSAGPGEDPIGRAIGGGLAAGAGSAINPQAGYEFAFNVGERPKMEADLRRERAEKAAMLEDILGPLKIDDLRATIDERRAQAEKLRRPEVPRPHAPAWHQVVGPDGQPILVDMNDPANAGKVFNPYIKPDEPKPPRQPTAAELTVDPSGKSVEEIARDSYESRGGDAYVLSKLPARTRRILTEGKLVAGGKERDAVEAEINGAQREFERAIDRQMRADLDYTKGRVRGRRLGAPGGSRAQPAASSGISRPRSQFNTGKFPGLRFD